CTLVNSEQLLTITAHRGGSVLLPCSCPDLQTKPEELWSRESGQYRKRVQLFNDSSPGNLSLLISHLTEEDGGDYQCGVKGSHTTIRLTVKESLPFVPFALVTVIFLHIVVGVVYCTRRTKVLFWIIHMLSGNLQTGLDLYCLKQGDTPGPAGCCTLENRDQPLTITAHRGGSVLLPCSCTNLQTKPEGLKWWKFNTNIQRREVISRESDQYRNRVQLVNDHSPGNLSLLISHLTEEDGGDYTCEVTGAHIIFRLTFQGCTLVNSEQQLQDKQPLTITGHTGGSVLLPCYCPDLQTKPEEFSWKIDNRNTQTWEQISSESGQYRNRVQLFNDHSPGNLSLLISHLTEEDGGDYECAVKGSYTTIRLTVK
ncbi:hypothetical protein NFI96_028507, partial [Prochilodus magdalenae]